MELHNHRGCQELHLRFQGEVFLGILAGHFASNAAGNSEKLPVSETSYLPMVLTGSWGTHFKVC